MSNCAHGPRVFREGNGPKGHWQAWFCDTPKGTPDQCSPEWVKTKKNASPSIAQGVNAHLPVSPNGISFGQGERIIQLLEKLAGE